MEQARAWIESAQSVAVLTGAGISSESGVPTFRGPGGVWNQFRAEDLATPEALARDPLLVWRWYDSRRTALAAVEPNAGHRAIAELERRKTRFTLITQNVDNLHERAGNSGPLKLHGDIWTLRCTGCAHEAPDHRTPLPDLPPRCEHCGAMLRPAVILFGELLPHAVWERAEAAVRAADVLLVVGTSAVVYPAAGLVPLARSCGARVIECNIEETQFSAGLDCSLRGRAGDLLPQLLS